MKFERGSIVEVSFLMPDKNGTEAHPAIILSNEDMYNTDECYLVVMITHYKTIDLFTFELSSEMFNKADCYSEGTQARCHLVTYIREKDIIINSKSGKCKMKRNQVNKLVEQIAEISMGE